MKKLNFGEPKFVFFTSDKRVSYAKNTRKTKNIVHDSKEFIKTNSDIRCRILSTKHPLKNDVKNIN